jgi:hypothetical protein
MQEDSNSFIDNFTDRLYLETKESHTQVDRHPFVSLIRKDKVAGEMYINFNKICIHEIQNVLKLKDNNLSTKLYRDIDLQEMYISNTLFKLLNHCKTYPLESGYQFYLGLLFGGNMLKRMLPEHTSFLTYENNKELIKEFKSYLNKNIDNQDLFIKRVNEAYILIKQLFDEYHKKLTN